MLKYAFKRLRETIPTTIGVLLLTFALFNVVGGSPALTVLGKNASAEAVETFNRKHGYDKPLVIGDFDCSSLQGMLKPQYINHHPPSPLRGTPPILRGERS